MKQIELETYIATDSVKDILIGDCGDDWMLTAIFKRGVKIGNGTAALHTARGEVKMFASTDSALKAARMAGWRGSVLIAATEYLPVADGVDDDAAANAAFERLDATLVRDAQAKRAANPQYRPTVMELGAIDRALIAQAKERLARGLAV